MRSIVGMEAEVGLFSKRRSRNTRSRPLLRWLGPGVTTAGLLYVLYALIGGGWNFAALDRMLDSSEIASLRGEPVVLADAVSRPPDRLRIATFNIRQFGQSKSGTRVNDQGVDVLGTIARVVSSFDIVAIQEIQSPDGIAVRRLVELLNQSGGTYNATMSDLIGDQRLESYAFLWDDSRIQFIEGSSYVVRDDADRMHREPMVATFQARLPVTTGESQIRSGDQPSLNANAPRQPFRFTLINVHTDPDEVDPNVPSSEINVLADVFQSVREYEYARQREDDFILLGDLNVSEKKLGQLTTIPGMFSIAGDIQTNVTRSATYDHILIDRQITAEYTQKMGVIDLIRDFRLTPDQAKTISDHIPVWGEFHIHEAAPPFRRQSTASGPRTTVVQ